MTKDHRTSLTSTYSFDLREIAAWQLEMKAPEYRQHYRRASLPLLQRGAVWKAYQVEALWDSLLRGFPLGSFILSRFDRQMGEQSAKYCAVVGKVDKDPEFHILDGQQRANAIAVGFIDPTLSAGLYCVVSDSEGWPPDALWIDLAPDTKYLKDRSFLFRMVTRSHPWGYRASNPRQILQTKDMRDWIKELKGPHSSPSLQVRVGKIPLSVAWPWDANAPVPFAFVLEALLEGSTNPWERIRERLESIPHAKKMLDEHLTWKGEVLRLLRTPTKDMEVILEATSSALEKTTIPGIVVEPGRLKGTEDFQILFARLNSAGTDLGSEELLYSMLKAQWPEAYSVVENAAEGLMSPSRLVLFASRLAIDETMEKDTPPRTPDFARFRGLIRGTDQQDSDFRTRMAGYVRAEAGSLFLNALKDAQKLLCYDNDRADASDFRLPGMLVATIAQQSQDILFAAIVWLARLRQTAVVDPSSAPIDNLSEAERRAFVAGISLLHWFGIDQSACLRILWQEIRTAGDAGELRNIWSRVTRKCFSVEEDQSIVALPPLPPDLLLDRTCRSMSNFENWNPSDWRDWNWEAKVNALPVDDLEKWMQSSVTPLSPSLKDLSDKDRLWPANAWREFVDRIFGQRELLLYGQRRYIGRWYPEHDPVQGGRLEDTNRPWDYDHIMPSYYIAGRWSIPPVIKKWHGTIGNLRIWPMEANRSDGEEVPAKKLWCGEADLDPSYGLSTPEDVQAASLVGDSWSRDLLGDQLDSWKSASPSTDGNNPGFLRDEANIGCRLALLKAIASRTVGIYKRWYDDLEIGSLV